MGLLLPNGTEHVPEACNRCGAPAGAPLAEPVTCTADMMRAAGHPVDDGALVLDDHGHIVDGRCLACRLGARIPIDVRALTPHQQLALFVLAGAYLDGDPDADSDDNVNRSVIDAVGPDVVQRLARGVLALGIDIGAVLHDESCAQLRGGAVMPCTCHGGPGFLYRLDGVDLALAAAEQALTAARMPTDG